MAKRQRNQQVTASFHYLIKSQDEDDDENPAEEGFSQDEFQRVVNRIRDTRPMDETNDGVINAIKTGRDLPFNHYEEVERGLHFGNFDGAYYGQRFRNNRLGIVEASDLNLRGFHYLITRLRDGKIVIGTSYHGLFGDYEGLKSCFSRILKGQHKVASRALKSVSAEIGSGEPVSLKLFYRKSSGRAERRSLFGTTGAIAIKGSDFGDDFGERVNTVAREVSGDAAQRRRALARLVSRDELLTLDEDDIVGCSAVVRENGRQRTVYLLGENSFSTRFPLTVRLDQHGLADQDVIKREMVRVLRQNIIPLIV